MTEGAPPGSRPKAVRTSLVDSGWSVTPPPSDEAATELPRLPLPETRPLPSYSEHEASSGLPDVTQVDPKIQSRAKAMREKDTLPPPRRASAFPPAPPPVPVVRPQEPPVVIQSASQVARSATATPISVRPPPPPSRPSARPPPPSVRPPPPSRPASPSVRPPMPAARVVAAQPSVPPPPAPAQQEADASSIAAARSAATIVRPRSLQPPALPSFAAALAQRVRFAGGEVPLWSLVTPLVLLVALGAAFAAAAVTSATEPVALAAAPKASAEPSASAAVLAAPPPAPAASPTSPQNNEEKPKPLTLLERVAQGEEAAVKELASKPPASLDVEEAISLSLGQSAQDERAARALRQRVEHDPGVIKDPEALAGLRRFADNPETARDALAAMANVPGPISPDLIYEVWTSTASRTTATDLARSLIYSKEIRAKASPALAAALDLRDAESCEQNRDLLPRVTTDGDKRAFHLLSKLTRKYGCGPNKRQDCYGCLRDGKDLDAALKAVKARRDPRPFGG